MRKYKDGGEDIRAVEHAQEQESKGTAALAGHEAEGQRQDALVAQVQAQGEALKRIEGMLSRSSVQRREYKAVEGQTIPLDAGTVTATIINNGGYPVGVRIVGYQTVFVVEAFGQIAASDYMREIDVEGFRGLTVHKGADVMSAAQVDLYDTNNVPPLAYKTADIDVTVILSNRRK